MRTVNARTMAAKLVEEMANRNSWGGSAYIEYRTPLFGFSTAKATGKVTMSRKMVLRHRTELEPAFLADGKPDEYKSGEKKGKQKMLGRLNPFWDHAEDRPKLIKRCKMQVQIGFDWQTVLRSMQQRGGLDPDFVAGGGAPTWRKQTEFIKVKISGKDKKTVFFYKQNISPENVVQPFDPKKDRIYLACLTPMNPIIKTESYYEELYPAPGKEPARFLKSELTDWLNAEADEDDIAESQGHEGKPELNRFMFTPKIENLVSISAFGRKYRMPLVKWDEVDPLNFGEIDGFVEEDDFAVGELIVRWENAFREAYGESSTVNPIIESPKTPVQ